MSYLILPTEQDAVERSRLAWESVLGRKKHVEDVTEFLWGIDVGKDGQAALIIDSGTEKLTEQEQALVISLLPAGAGENWEKEGSVIDSTAVK
jgi:hypothetical protein